jgi:hypothetical protein
MAVRFGKGGAMFVPHTPSPAHQIALGAAIALVAFAALTLFLDGCGAAVSPALIQCKLDALRVLPDDIRMVTPYDAEDIWRRVRACEAGAADGGAP